MTRLFLPLFLLIFSALPVYAAEITGLRVQINESGERVSVHLTGETGYRVFEMEAKPPRVVVDLEDVKLHGTLSLPEDYDGTLIRGVRFGAHGKTAGRIVLDLTASIRPANMQMVESEEEKGGYWLQFDLSPPSAPRGHRHAAVKPKRKAEREPSHETKHNSQPVVVIDAGHGGQDPGTAGHGGTREKDLTLRYAQALQQALQKTGRYRVALTRDTDHYLLLRERVRLAREAHGDLFISLHADSAPTRQARGLSVYTISEKSSDKESEALAAQENHADVIGGMDLSDTSDDVAGILIDLAERETRTKSGEFADLAIKYLGRAVGLLSNTHRFAGFAVLKAPDIPSVLVEIGFLTNPREESQLKSNAYRAKVVRGLAQAVDEYFKKKR